MQEFFLTKQNKTAITKNGKTDILRYLNTDIFSRKSLGESPLT